VGKSAGATVSSAGPALATPATITKSVGEPGAFYCPPDKPGLASCSVQFTVTKIESVPRSSCDQNTQVPAENRVIRVAIDVQGRYPLPAPNSHLEPGYVVDWGNWVVLGRDGYTTKVETAIDCGSFEPGAFYKWAAAGEKKRGELVFSIPANSVKLQLRVSGSPNPLEWDLPHA